MIGEFVRTRDKLEKPRTRIDVPCLFILIPHITLPLLSSDDRSLYVCLSAKADKGYHLPLTDTKCDHPKIYAVKAGSQIRVYVDDDPKGSVFRCGYGTPTSLCTLLFVLKFSKNCRRYARCLRCFRLLRQRLVACILHGYEILLVGSS